MLNAPPYTTVLRYPTYRAQKAKKAPQNSIIIIHFKNPYVKNTGIPYTTGAAPFKYLNLHRSRLWATARSNETEPELEPPESEPKPEGTEWWCTALVSASAEVCCAWSLVLRLMGLWLLLLPLREAGAFFFLLLLLLLLLLSWNNPQAARAPKENLSISRSVTSHKFATSEGQPPWM